jgi:hypothetical protein
MNRQQREHEPFYRLIVSGRCDSASAREDVRAVTRLASILGAGVGFVDEARPRVQSAASGYAECGGAVFRTDAYSADDVVQGKLADCWFLAALALAASSGGGAWVARLFAPAPLLAGLGNALAPADAAAALLGPRVLPLCPQGVYQVKLCVDGLWRWLTLDAAVPACGDGGGAPAYAHGARSQLWVALVEKAAAKAAGGYDALHFGFVAEGLRLLTGAPVFHFLLHTAELQAERDARHAAERRGDFGARASGGARGDGWGEFRLGATPPPDVLAAAWARLRAWLARGHLLGALTTAPGSPGMPGAAFAPSVVRHFEGRMGEWRAQLVAYARAVKEQGLSFTHCYSLLRAVEVEGGAGTAAPPLRLLQLRNPLAPPNAQWRGAWSSGCSRWAAHPAAAAAAAPHAGPQRFWMALEDFCTFFFTCDGARVHAGSCARARLRLPSRQHGLMGLRLAPVADVIVDCVATDISHSLPDGKQEESEGEVEGEGEGGGGEGGGGKGGSEGGGAGAAPTTPYQWRGHNWRWGGLLPRRDLALALVAEGAEGLERGRVGLAASGAAVAAASRWERFGHEGAALQPVTLQAGRTYMLLPLSMGEWEEDPPPPPGAAVVEVHYEGEEGALRAEVVALDAAWVHEFAHLKDAE